MGTAVMGKTAVYQYGTGVDVVMLKRYKMEEYLKRLYRLDYLPLPTAADSIFAEQVFSKSDTLFAETDSLDQSERGHGRGDIGSGENRLQAEHH
jgi:hypothetical protein